MGRAVGAGEQYQVVRYHSLVVEEASLPPTLRAIAWAQGHHSLTIGAVRKPPCPAACQVHVLRWNAEGVRM